MSRKPLPYAERPTWQRVKDLTEAAHYTRTTIASALALWEHVPESPAARDAIKKYLTEAQALLNDATGQVEA